MTESLNQGRVRLKAKDAKIQDLEVEISIARAKVIRMRLQLSTVKKIRNQAFSYGYGAILQCLKSFLVAIPWTNRHSLNSQDLRPNPISWQQLYRRCPKLIPYAFPPSEP